MAGIAIDSRHTGPAVARRQAAIVCLLAALLALVGLGAYWLAIDQPLEQGSVSGAGPAGGLFVERLDDPFGSGSLYVYCGVPDTTYPWLISVRNDGPLPVTLLGAAPPGAVSAGAASTNAFWLADVAQARVAGPGDVPSGARAMTDPRTAPALSPVTLQPTDEIELWARIRTGGGSPSPGAGLMLRSIDLRVSILGLPRTVDVPLRDGLEVIGTPCPAMASGAGP